MDFQYQYCQVNFEERSWGVTAEAREYRPKGLDTFMYSKGRFRSNQEVLRHMQGRLENCGFFPIPSSDPLTPVPTFRRVMYDKNAVETHEYRIVVRRDSFAEWKALGIFPRRKLTSAIFQMFALAPYGWVCVDSTGTLDLDRENNVADSSLCQVLENDGWRRVLGDVRLFRRPLVRTPPVVAQELSGNLIDVLRELKSLHDTQALTADEFAEVKRALFRKLLIAA